MNILVTGGSASGKSRYAERAAASLGGPLLYLATMRPWDDECRARIEKHRRQRAGQGFETVECYTDLRDLILPARGTVLLECLGNLTANVLFSGQAPDDPAAAILDGIGSVARQSEHLVVVANEVFSDGVRYDASTARYLSVMAAVSRALGARFDAVTEVVCGIPLARKGALL